MKFCLSFFGDEPTFHLRRDLFLAIKYSLEEIGHEVDFSWMFLDPSRFNLILGAYFLPSDQIQKITLSGLQFAHINTEVIANDMLNFTPSKTDFMGAYLPSMRAGQFVWDVIRDNLEQHRKYEINAHFMRWGWHSRLEEIDHRERKDLDFYFFGTMSKRRQSIIQDLSRRGFVGGADHSCPTFLRNDRIARARVNLNLVQHDHYTHVNSFRICYLANNRCAILSEIENDPANYLSVARIVRSKDSIADAMTDLLAEEKWKQLAEAGYETFRATPMTQCMEELLELSFSAREGVRPRSG
jgi:hypothetical protein